MNGGPLSDVIPVYIHHLRKLLGDRSDIQTIHSVGYTCYGVRGITRLKVGKTRETQKNMYIADEDLIKISRSNHVSFNTE